jgi:zinc/manganese transport system permease protein
MFILQLLAAPFAACLIIAALHCYMGLHIIRRGVIFVDLALAQMAALGGVVALFVGPHVLGPSRVHPAGADTPAVVMDSGHEESAAEELFGYAMSLTFAFLGAGLFSIGRFRDNRVPHEAIIGIVYVVSAALALLVLNKSAADTDEIGGMLLGHLLVVRPGEVARTAIIYAVLAVPHLIWGRRFLLISSDLPAAQARGINIRLWDFIFYAIFGVMVTQSVHLGGVLVVFSFLIIPAVCAAIFFRSFWSALLFGWGVALLGSILGLWFSVQADMPTGASLVATFGFMLAVCSVIYKLTRRRLPARGSA